MVCTCEELSSFHRWAWRLFPCQSSVQNFETTEVRTFPHNVRVAVFPLYRFSLLLIEIQKTENGSKGLVKEPRFHGIVMLTQIGIVQYQSHTLLDIPAFLVFHSHLEALLILNFFYGDFWVCFQVEWSSCVCAQFHNYELVFCCNFGKKY